MKKKGKKKKTVKSAKPKTDRDTGPGDFPESDPDTAIGGETDGGKKKKKKGKKPKLSKSEKAQEKLEKAATMLQLSGQRYLDFLERTDRWLRFNSREAVRLFKQVETQEEGLLTYEDFKSGMFDLGAPCNDVELHLLARLLDSDNDGDIDWRELEDGLDHIKERAAAGKTTLDYDDDDDEMEEEMSALSITDDAVRLHPTRRTFPHCACCKMSVCEPSQEQNPRYIRLQLRLVTFDGQRHPGHVDETVCCHVTVRTIIQLIIDQTSTASSTITIFTDKSRSKDKSLLPHCTLSDYGYQGSVLPSQAPGLLLYWDYKADFVECPLLLADYYFLK